MGYWSPCMRKSERRLSLNLNVGRASTLRSTATPVLRSSTATEDGEDGSCLACERACASRMMGHPSASPTVQAGSLPFVAVYPSCRRATSRQNRHLLAEARWIHCFRLRGHDQRLAYLRSLGCSFIRGRIDCLSSRSLFRFRAWWDASRLSAVPASARFSFAYRIRLRVLEFLARRFPANYVYVQSEWVDDHRVAPETRRSTE